MNGKNILGSKNTYGMYWKENGSGGNGRVCYTNLTKNGLWAVLFFLGTYDGGFSLSLRGLGISQMGKGFAGVKRKWKVY